MRIGKKFVGLLTIFMSMSLLSIGMISNRRQSNETQAASSYDCVFADDKNANNPIMYKKTSSNITNWSTYPGATNTKGEIRYSDLSANKPSELSIGGVGTNTLTLSFLEAAENNDVVVMYRPFRLHIFNVPEYTRLNTNFQVTCSVKGGSSDSTVTTYFYWFGRYIGDNARDIKPSAFTIPSNSSNVGSMGESSWRGYVSNNSRITATTQNITGNTSNINVDNAVNYVGQPAAAYCGVYVCASKGTNPRKIEVNVTCKATVTTESTLYVKNSTTNVSYSSFKDAYNNAASGNTLSLLQDTVVGTYITTNKNLTIDLNGHKLDTEVNFFTVGSGYTLNLTGGGTMEGRYINQSSAFLVNNGTLNIDSTVLIKSFHDSQVGNNGILQQAGTLNFSGTIACSGDCIMVAGGTCNILPGASLTSHACYALNITGGNTYISASTTFAFTNVNNLSFTRNISLNYKTGNLYGCNSSNTSYYNGSELKVNLTSTPTLNDTIIRGVGSANKFSFLNTPALGNEYAYDSSSKSIKYVALKRNVTFNIENCTVSGDSTYTYGSTTYWYITADTGYSLPMSLRVECGGAVLTQTTDYSYNNSTGRFNLIFSSRINSDVTVIASGIINQYRVYYLGNGGSGSMADSTEYDYNTKATLKANEYTYEYHTFVGWNTNKNANVATYNPGDQITMTADITLYAIWTQTDGDFVDFYCDNSLKMNVYDTSLDNSEGTGACMTYYSLAKGNYNLLTNDQKALFSEDAKYDDARNRLSAWAAANGEVFDPTNHTFSARVTDNNVINNSNGNVSIIVAISLLTSSSLLFIVVAKKKYRRSR